MADTQGSGTLTPGAPAQSALLDYLPAIYREDPFVGRFLLAFEKLLLGRGDGVTLDGRPVVGLEEVIAGLAGLFDPSGTPEEFLAWLSNWTAFTLRADLSPKQQRDFTARVIQLYRMRGTKRSLQELLGIFVVGVPTISEPEASELQVGVTSTVGRDTNVGGAPPYYFRVTISLPKTTPALHDRQREIAHALIEMEKPAHTTYDLDVIFPSMKIGVYSTVGVDTLLGSAT